MMSASGERSGPAAAASCRGRLAGYDLDAVRARFPALSISDGGLPRIHLDNPAGTQVPRQVVDRMAECMLEANANLGGAFRSSVLAGEIVDDALRAMADFLNAPSADEIVFGPNMTTITFHVSRSIGRHIAASLAEGDEIVLSRMDHDANVYPWVLMARDHGLTVRWLPFDVDTFEFDLDELDGLLSSRTRLVCVGAASNLTGTINDVAEICRRAREVGAWTYIDAVQSAPHVVTDVQAIGCDFLCCSAYKFFGPHQGILWGRREVLERLEPYKVRPAPADPPWSFAPGTASHEGMAGTAAAIDYLAWIGETMVVTADRVSGHGGGFSEAMSSDTASDTASAHEAPPPRGRREHLAAALDLLFDYEQTLSTRLTGGLESLPGVRVLGITSPDAMPRRVPTVAFVVAGLPPAELARRLAADNIFVWSGHNYAVEAAEALGILDSGGAVRVGAAHYNSLAEIDRFLAALGGMLPAA